MGAICQATYEPAKTERERAGTHACDLPLHHPGPHVCPRCGTVWTRRAYARRGRVVVTPPGGESDG